MKNAKMVERRNKLREIELKHPKNENIKLYTRNRKKTNKTLRSGKNNTKKRE